MMDVKDAHKVSDNLFTKPFICHENYIEVDGGYIITKKEYFEELEKEANEQVGTIQS